MNEAALPLRQLLVVDDDTALRRRLLGVIAQVAPAAQCSQAASLAEARAQLQQRRFDLVLLDVGLPDGSGLELLPWLAAHAPDSDAVVVSSLGDDATVLQAIQGGAVGYLLKNGSDTELALSLASLQRSGAPIDPVIARRVLALMAAPSAGTTLGNIPPAIAPAPRSDLSERETEVLQLVAQGHSNREIARSLNLSVNTVECHAKNIYRKLAVRSRAGAVHAARSKGWLS